MTRWFRWYKDTSSDVKFKLIADQASYTMCPVSVNARDVIAVWVALLERVEDDNGTVTGRNGGVTKYITRALDISHDMAETIVCAMVDHGLLNRTTADSFSVSKWKSRQYLDTTNAERQARYRAKHRVTEKRNGEVTPTETETETEIDRGAKSRRASRAMRLPNDWTPGEGLCSSLEAEGFSRAEQFKELLKFTDHWKATGKRMVDWEATFRNWMRRSADMRPRPLNGAGRVVNSQTGRLKTFEPEAPTPKRTEEQQRAIDAQIRRAVRK